MEPQPLGLKANNRAAQPAGISQGPAITRDQSYAARSFRNLTPFPVPSFGLIQSSATDRRRRRRAMLVSPIFEALVIAIFLWMLAVLPRVPVEHIRRETLMVPLVAPPEQPEPMPKPVRVPLRKAASIVHPPRIRVPKVMAMRERPPVVPEQKFEMPKPPKTDQVTLPAAMPKLAVVHPAAFSAGSSAKPTVRLPISKVQTGGFGDPQGLPGRAEGGSKGNVPKLGSFDLPSGPGKGNGSGGARGVAGVVASAGFGSGIAVAPGGDNAARMVQTSGFGNAVVGQDNHHAGSQQGTPDFVPAVIISKPDPVYPPEARKLHIEGEVLLSAVFEASGQVHVLRVVRGLGQGMDQAAKRAAEGIVFKPARRDGRPVDMEALVHIIFQLAY